MRSVLDYPLAIFALAFAGQWLAAYLGYFLRTSRGRTQGAEQEDFATVLAAALTLLGLIIGFSFSMSVNRYDLRKNYEEAEANAIGTEYMRDDLLPSAEAARLRDVLSKYLQQRLDFYLLRDEGRLQQINLETDRIQNQLWSIVLGPAMAQPTPVAALAVAGMNDVLNSQGYTQAAWWNRIPPAAWGLMGLVAIACNVLLGYCQRHPSRARLIVLPMIVAVSFCLIADIDSPRGGLIRVVPQNLVALSQTFKPN